MVLERKLLFEIGGARNFQLRVRIWDNDITGFFSLKIFPISWRYRKLWNCQETWGT
jgi:hypothetical protein